MIRVKVVLDSCCPSRILRSMNPAGNLYNKALMVSPNSNDCQPECASRLSLVTLPKLPVLLVDAVHPQQARPRSATPQDSLTGLGHCQLQVYFVSSWPNPCIKYRALNTYLYLLLLRLLNNSASYRPYMLVLLIYSLSCDNGLKYCLTSGFIYLGSTDCLLTKSLSKK